MNLCIIKCLDQHSSCVILMGGLIIIDTVAIISSQYTAGSFGNGKTKTKYIELLGIAKWIIEIHNVDEW